jgi:hypothetical protein
MGTRQIDESKVRAARDYLARSFSACRVDDFHDFDTVTQVFTIEGLARHQVVISADFLDDRTPSEIDQTLTSWRVAEKLGRSGAQTIRVTNEGARLEGQER